MHHRRHLGKGVRLLESDDKVLEVEVIADLTAREVVDLSAVGEVVHDQNVGLAHRIEALEPMAANEACAAGHHNHVDCPRILSIMRVEDCPSMNGRIFTSPPTAITLSPPTTASGV